MIFSIIFTVLVAIVFSRGIFELLLTKEIGYFAGILSLFLIAIFVILKNFYEKGTIYSPRGISAWFLFIYTLFAVISLLVTMFLDGPIFLGILYTTLHVFLLAVILLLHLNNTIQLTSLCWYTACSGIIISCSGLLEYLDVIQFPGSWEFSEDYSRLAGSLGSKQHFSFASASMGMITFWFYLQTQKIILFIIAISLILLTFLSFSRNGMPIIVGTMLLYYISDLKRLIKYSWRILLVLFVAAAGLSYYNSELYSVIYEVFLSIGSFNDQANSARLAGWMKGIEVILNGHIFFGTETGSYSQAGDRLGIMNSSHFESAVIQQFANYGIIGGLAFISFFISYIVSMKRVFLRALATMVALTYFYYPGSETLPIVGVWMLITLCDTTKPINKSIEDENIRGSAKGGFQSWRVTGKGY